MDTNHQIPKPKKKKVDGGEEMEGQNKSLSNLPDVLIVKILCLLETKDAIRTSVLSKRWEYLWTSVPKLSFTKSRLNTTASLVNVVERALVLRGPADIKKFSLVMPVLSDVSRIRAWISAVVRRNVEDLSICLYNFKEPLQETNLLPCSLFTSATLVELYLMLPCMFKVPCSVSLSTLRCLNLTHLVFSDDYSTQKLFSGCPVLEELSFTECSWMNVKFVSICAPKLLTLMVTEMDVEYPSGSDGCQIIVCGSSLNYYSYAGRFQNDHCFDNLSSLEEVVIISDSSSKHLKHDSYCLYKLLRGLSSMKNLMICYTCFEDLWIYASELLDHMPLFSDLTTLILDSTPVYIGSKGLLRILKNCPSLHTMVFCEGISVSSYYGTADRVLEPWPACICATLEVVKVERFDGDQDEIQALKVLLKNAKVLKRMSIFCSDIIQEKKRYIFNQLAEVPKGSQSCDIAIY